MRLDDEYELFLLGEYIIDWVGYYLERIHYSLENEI
jgi:hypothetical protein